MNFHAHEVLAPETEAQVGFLGWKRIPIDRTICQSYGRAAPLGVDFYVEVNYLLPLLCLRYAEEGLHKLLLGINPDGHIVVDSIRNV